MVDESSANPRCSALGPTWLLARSCERRAVQRRSEDCSSPNVSLDRRVALSSRVAEYKTD